MLTVTKKNYYGKKDVVIDYFANIKHVFDYFKNIYGAYNLEERFSHNPNEFYRRFFDYHNIPGIRGYTFDAPEYCYVITNDKGIRYSREFILGSFRKIRKDRKFRTYRYFHYFTGYKRHRRGSGYHRKPHTFQERKMSVNVLIEEGEPKWRTSRNFHNLPTSWDDIQHMDVCNDNWKRYRRTRWK